MMRMIMIYLYIYIHKRERERVRETGRQTEKERRIQGEIDSIILQILI